jgi:hypothetical protein
MPLWDINDTTVSLESLLSVSPRNTSRFDRRKNAENEILEVNFTVRFFKSKCYLN